MEEAVVAVGSSSSNSRVSSACKMTRQWIKSQDSNKEARTDVMFLQSTGEYIAVPLEPNRAQDDYPGESAPWMVADGRTGRV